MHVLEPFLPDISTTPDHSDSDLAAEFAAHALIQRSVKQFLSGEMTLDTFENILNEHGIDPIAYWDVVEDNVNAIVESDRAQDIDSCEDLILLPGRDF